MWITEHYEVDLQILPHSQCDTLQPQQEQLERLLLNVFFILLYLVLYTTQVSKKLYRKPLVILWTLVVFFITPCWRSAPLLSAGENLLVRQCSQ